MNKPSAIARAVEAAGTQAELSRRLKARELNVDYQRVHRWLKRGWVTPKYAMDIEQVTGVSVIDLLADAEVVVPLEGSKKKRR